jgi:4-hydroxybenzoate polyprenyltransferase
MSLPGNENNLPFFSRLYIYQKERFPVLGHGLLVAAFSFSAISYSRICRGAEGFVSWKIFLVGIFTTVSLFFLVRIFDEFKDKEEDALYRKYLPVPRGLINLKELKILGIITVVFQVVLNFIFFPKMLWIYFIIIAYLCLMGKEFFIPKWLKKHQFWYVTSHMFIIPLIDIYASGLDWFLGGVKAPIGLFFFFAVSYMNGIVLEIGRKIKPRGSEEEGVNSYTKMIGENKAPVLWIGILFITFCLAVLAAQYAGYGKMALSVLSFFFIICSIPAILFLKKKNTRSAKSIEISSALWTIAMYLSLGGIPMLQKLLFN